MSILPKNLHVFKGDIADKPVTQIFLCTLPLMHILREEKLFYLIFYMYYNIFQCLFVAGIKKNFCKLN